ncbi:MAG: sigma-70 family RNA polymerase sigma factor [Tepidisphaeraceae bacterium]
MIANPDRARPEKAPGVDRGFPADDRALLLRYVQSTSQAAFSELVARHHRLVHSTCTKVLRNPDLADDATQTVFMTLARKASSLPADTRLRGWLYHTARHVAADLRKQETRRLRRHHRVAATALERENGSDAPDENLRLTVADIISRLSVCDRRAIVMRYFEGLTLREMARALGLSREGAKKRVARALARIRAYLAAKNWLLPICLPLAALTRKSSVAKAMAFAAAAAPARIIRTLAKNLRSLFALAAGASRLTAARVATTSTLVAVALLSETKLPLSPPTAVSFQGPILPALYSPENLATYVAAPSAPAPAPATLRHLIDPAARRGFPGIVATASRAKAVSVPSALQPTAHGTNVSMAPVRVNRNELQAVSNPVKSSVPSESPLLMSGNSARSIPTSGSVNPIQPVADPSGPLDGTDFARDARPRELPVLGILVSPLRLPYPPSGMVMLGLHTDDPQDLALGNLVYARLQRGDAISVSFKKPPEVGPPGDRVLSSFVVGSGQLPGVNPMGVVMTAASAPDPQVPDILREGTPIFAHAAMFPAVDVMDVSPAQALLSPSAQASSPQAPLPQSLLPEAMLPDATMAVFSSTQMSSMISLPVEPPVLSLDSVSGDAAPSVVFSDSLVGFSSVQSVPEPTGPILLMTAAALLLLRRVPRRRP